MMPPLLNNFPCRCIKKKHIPIGQVKPSERLRSGNQNKLGLTIGRVCNVNEATTTGIHSGCIPDGVPTI